MAEIKSGDVARFLKNLPKSYFAFLICGSDSGLVAERTRHIVRALAGLDNDPFRVVRLDGDALAQDSKLLADEALTIGLFGGDRILWISAGSKSFVPSLELLLSLEPMGCKVIIEAGALKNDSALKRVCLKSQNVAVLECWPDGPREIANLVEEEMSSAGLSISAEARDLLTSLLGGDRLLSRGEIDKIKSYAHGQCMVSESDILAVVTDASSTSFDQAIGAAFDGDRIGVLDVTKKVVVDFDPGALLSLALAHAILLHSLRLEIEGGRSVEDAIDHGPRLFGKKKSSIALQLKIWDASALLQQSAKLSEAVRLSRREPKLSDEIAIRSLLSIAHSAPRQKTARRSA